jgi:hypothetical protein
VLTELGLAVVREIPVQTLAGLVSGAYTLHGGVVRDAGGRIVAHLLSSGPADLIKSTIPGLNVLSSLVGSGQLYSFAHDVEELRGLVESVMTVASAGAALSGIGLIANVAGTAFLSRKLDAVQTQLERIERLLNEQHLSVLRGAVDNLRHAEHAADMETRKAMLVSAKTDFSKSAHFYGSQFADPRSLQEVLALEDSFALAVIGSALCLSELGMYGAAAADFEGHYDRWRPLAQKHVQQHFLGDAPYRLLGDVSVEDVPAADLVASLDFVHSTRKSWAWIDEMRRDKAAARIAIPTWSSKDKAVREAAGMATKLRAKDSTLSAFSEHLRLLDQKRLSASGFAAAAESARKEIDAPGAWLVGGSS